MKLKEYQKLSYGHMDQLLWDGKLVTHYEEMIAFLLGLFEYFMHSKINLQVKKLHYSEIHDNVLRGLSLQVLLITADYLLWWWK